MKLQLTAALGAALHLLTAGDGKAYTFDYIPFPPGGFVDTTFGWEAGGGPVHGIGSRVGGPFQPYTPGDTEWIVDVPEPGGEFLFVQIYSPVIDSLFALSLNGTVLDWDSQIPSDIGTYAEIFNLPMPQGLNVFSVEILRDGNERYSSDEMLGPDDLRYGALSLNTDPGAFPKIPLPPALLPLLGALGLLAGLKLAARRPV